MTKKKIFVANFVSKVAKLVILISNRVSAIHTPNVFLTFHRPWLVLFEKETTLGKRRLHDRSTRALSLNKIGEQTSTQRSFSLFTGPFHILCVLDRVSFMELLATTNMYCYVRVRFLSFWRLLPLGHSPLFFFSLSFLYKKIKYSYNCF